MTAPVTLWHYAPNDNVVNGVYRPGVDGFNLADVSSVSVLNALPKGVEGLVWVGLTGGVTAAFKSAVNAFLGDKRVYGFYLADEPGRSAATAANLKAESDYIHAHFPGAKTFMVEQNFGDSSSPRFYYTPANTHIDLFGLDPYPARSDLPNRFDPAIIPLAVKAALAVKIPRADLVPVYQAFGGLSPWLLPTAAQETKILSAWGSVLPTPAFDYAYSWGVQDGDRAISDTPALQKVFAAHNKPAAAALAPPALDLAAAIGGWGVAAPAAETWGFGAPNAGSASPLAAGPAPAPFAFAAAAVSGTWTGFSGWGGHA